MPEYLVDENKEHALNQIHVEASDVIDVEQEQIFAVLSDYREGHHAIIDVSYFQTRAAKPIRLRPLLKGFGCVR
jgi:hypothetical protein